MSENAPVPLERATDEARFGGKAANLARLIGAGVKTPPGLALDADLLSEHLERLGLRTRAAAFWSSLVEADRFDGAGRAEAASLRQAVLESALAPRLTDTLETVLDPVSTYAVRSSAVGEDGAETSFAGQFDSVLGCDTPEAVSRAVRRVWASLFGERALSYALHGRCVPQGMGVVIQRQVDALVSGVVFTRDPLAPSSDSLLVEYCAGLGERLVSGRVSPGRLRIDRHDGSVTNEADPGEPLAWGHDFPAPWSALREVALKAEEIFGAPQDIEWSLDAAGQLHLLQARPVTRMASAPVGVVWTNANIAENFPDPVCPMLRSFVAKGYAAYFRGLGWAFGISERRVAAMSEALDNLVGCHGGRLYYNLSNIHTVLHLAPGGPLLARYFNQFTGARELPVPKRIRQGRVAQGLEIVWVALRVIWSYLHVQNGLKSFERRVDGYADASAPALLPELAKGQMADLLKGFLAIRLEHWTGAALADTAAMVCYGVLKALTSDREGLDANDLLKGLPGLASAVPVERLWELARDLRGDGALFRTIADTPAEVLFARLRDCELEALQTALTGYFDTWGFRSSGELMLTRPTPREDPLPTLRLLKTYLAMDGEGPGEISRRQAVQRECATREARRRLGFWRWGIFALVLRATQGAIRLRERARMKQALLYTRLRHVALALGGKLVAEGILGEPDDVLYLTMDEAIALAEGPNIQAADVRRRVAESRAELTAQMTWSPPDSFVLPEGRTWQAGSGTADEKDTHSAESLTGVGACGGRVRGRASVVLDVAEIDKVREDRILVTRQTDPGWAAVFFMVKGLVIERGGLLSHGAIIAREYGIPAVIGVRDATRLIADGDLLQVDGDRGSVQIVRD